MFERFTAGARGVVVDAQGQARRLGHNYVGTEHILLGLLVGQDGVAAAVLSDAGIDAATVEREIVRIVGRGSGPGPGGPGRGSDADALRILGIDIDAVREAAEAAFGPGALDWAQVSVARPGRRRFSRSRRRRRCERAHPVLGGHIPFTPRSKKVLELSLREALHLGHRSIGTEHILLGLIREGDGLAAEILVQRGVALEDLRRRVLSALDDAA